MKIIFKGVIKDIPAVFATDLINRGIAQKADQGLIESQPDEIVKKERKTRTKKEEEK